MKEWQSEPHTVEFPHAGFQCKIERAPEGFLRGYVFIPEDNYYFGKDEDDVHFLLGKKVGVEITFSDYRDGKWAIGFAFASIMDFLPYNLEDKGVLGEFMTKLKKDLGLNITEKDYKNLAYTMDKVEALAEALQVPVSN